MRSFFRTFIQGLVVVAPAIITVYVCSKSVIWLDQTIRAGLNPMGIDIPGIGVLAALTGIYLVGLLTKHWIFRSLIQLGESIVDRIPLVKSLYSAIRDLLQFLGGTDTSKKGRPARVHLLNGRVHMLGLITQKTPEDYMGEPEKGRTAVYLPMSYQIGGFTVFLPEDQVEELSDLTVEDVLKLSMTAGVGDSQNHHQAKSLPDQNPPPADKE
jgi:uncharacterized membrane protein